MNTLSTQAKFLFILTASSISVGHAAPGALSDSPLFTVNNIEPNVFFEVDDSGSMDWEILTLKHYETCAYATGVNVECGIEINSGLNRGETDNDGRQMFTYIFPNSDNVYSNDCDSGWHNTLKSCSDNSLQNYDWRVRSSSLNVLYYNPDIEYAPWEKGDGTAMPAASFTAARSNPESTSIGYSKKRNLKRFVYHVWTDSHGFTGARPLGGGVNQTVGSNGIVDWWDNHLRVIVKAKKIKIKTITHSGTTVTENVDSTITLTGTGPHPELGGKTIAQVQQNIATWYQYSRRRSFVTKAAIAKVITDNTNFRFGLNFINDTSFPYDAGTTKLVEVPAGAVGTSVDNVKLIKGMASLKWPAKGTPLRKGLKRAGKYYDNADGKTDPIIEECQQSFTVLLTDGYWNQGSPSGIGNADGDSYPGVSVADVARHYYLKDLSPLGSGATEHQPMVTYTVAFGLSGILTDSDSDGWPDDGGTPATNLAVNSDWGDFSIKDSPQKIDDLWHAAFNSDGTFVSARTPQEVSDALGDALGDIKNRLGSGASVSFNTSTLTGSSAVYLAQFNSNNNQWSGDLFSFPLDPVTGNVSATPDWSAADVLDAVVSPVTSRKIFTYDGTDGKQFIWADLTAAQQADLKINPNNTISDDATALTRLNFLRGDRSNEGGSLRLRSKLLGDIVHSDPVYVGTPSLAWPNVAPFSAGGVTYDDFISSATARAPMVYTGSNDGMLHGFDTATGNESMAYIPNSLYSSSSASSGLHYLTDPSYTHRFYNDLAITVSDVSIDTGAGDAWHTVLLGGGRAGSRGLFALDITDPADFIQDTAHAEQLVLWEFDGSDDADMGFAYSKPTIAMLDGGKWAAIFGNGYNSTGDGKAKLFIVYLEGGLDGIWTLGSDYEKISTEVGAIVSSDCSNVLSDCNGLSTPLLVDMDGDQIVDRAYAGDLHGNMWAFDLSNAGSFDVAYKTGATPKPLFIATNALLKQPITSKPMIAKHPSALGGDPDVLLFFGTGQYLNTNDISNTAVQSFYGVWDNGTHSLTPTDLVEQTFLAGTYTDIDGNDVSSEISVLTNNVVDYAGSDNGWVINLTEYAGERVVVDPDVRGDKVFFNTWIPDNGNACDAGGSGVLMSVTQLDGGRADNPIFDLNGDDDVDDEDFVTSGGTDYAPTGQKFTSGFPASSGFLSNKQYTPGTEGGKAGNSLIETRAVENLTGDGVGRLSWKELK